MNIKLTKFHLLLLVLLTTFPVALYSYKHTGIVAADFICILGVYYLVQNLKNLSFLLFTASAVFSILNVFISMYYGAGGIHNLLSFLFFFKPYLAFFVGYSFISTASQREEFIRFLAISFALTMIIITASVLFNFNGIVRNDSYLNGDFLGLPLFGAYGVNSLAAFYLLAFSILGYALYSDHLKRKYEQLIVSTGLIFSYYLIIGSLSRMALLGVVLMTVFLVTKSKLTPTLKTLLTLATLSVTFLYIHNYSFSGGDNMYDKKITQAMVSLKNHDIDNFSSNRITLYSYAIKQIADNPLDGVSFGGFQQKKSDRIKGFSDLAGLSPHNQYLTAIWKMGIPTAIFYFMMLISFHRTAFSSTPTIKDKHWLYCFAFVFSIVLCNVWDVFMIPNVSIIYFLILGSFANVNTTRPETQTNVLRHKYGTYNAQQSYCQIWCMAKILSSHLSVRLFNNLYPILKFNVINNEC